MKRLKELVKKVRKSPELSRKFFFVLFIFLVCRLLAHIPVPLIDSSQLRMFVQASQFLGILNVFSGGTLSNFSVVALGVGPYISASIVLQLAGLVLPKLKELQQEGERGRTRINQYTRYLAFPLAAVQSVSIIALLRTNNLLMTDNIWAWVAIAVILMAGSFLMVWLGELISRYGIGNGVSMIMTLGIVSQMPSMVAQTMAVTTTSQLFGMILLVVMIVAVIALVAFINAAVRQVPVQYAKRVRGSRTFGGQSTFLPIRVNSTGVLPVIFAMTLMSIPGFLGQVMAGFENQFWSSLGANLVSWFSTSSPVYLVVTFVATFIFTFLSSILLFDADHLAEELKKSGAFVPGIRPGEKTKLFLKAIVKNLTLAEATFLSGIALLPFILGAITGVGQIAIGGTSIMILVSVILETVKQIEGQTVGQNYDKYL